MLFGDEDFEDFLVLAYVEHVKLKGLEKKQALTFKEFKAAYKSNLAYYDRINDVVMTQMQKLEVQYMKDLGCNFKPQ